MPIPYTAGLHRLTEHSYAYLQPPGSWGRSNCGLVVDAVGGATAALVDTPFTLGLTRRMLETIRAALPEVTITTVINSHANGDHCWGNQLLPGVEIVGSAVAAAAMPHEIGPDGMRRMVTETAPQSPLGDYMRRFFGDYDWSGIVLTPPTRTFTGTTTVDLPGAPVEVIEVGPAHTTGDVIAVSADGVVFAGDILFVGDHPVMWTGPIDNWVSACSRILDTGATTIVPGHGPVTDRAGVVEFRDYLQRVGEYAIRQFQRAVPHTVAADKFDLDRYSGWGHAERLVVTIGTIYRLLGRDPGDRATLIDQMAQLYYRRRARQTSTVSGAAPTT